MSHWGFKGTDFVLDRGEYRHDADDEKGRWVTTKSGKHMHINEEEEPDKGNPHVLAAAKGEKESSTSKKSESKKSESKPKTSEKKTSESKKSEAKTTETAKTPSKVETLEQKFNAHNEEWKKTAQELEDATNAYSKNPNGDTLYALRVANEAFKKQNAVTAKAYKALQKEKKAQEGGTAKAEPKKSEEGTDKEKAAKKLSDLEQKFNAHNEKWKKAAQAKKKLEEVYNRNPDSWNAHMLRMANEEFQKQNAVTAKAYNALKKEKKRQGVE